MKVRLTPQARSDLELIYQYLSKRSASGATNVLGAIYNALNLLAEHPYAAQKTDRGRSALSVPNILRCFRR
jgi:plasmid stabilization system protein ParE